MVLPNSKTGFTLIEIIIVVVILGILASVAIPRITSPQEKIISSEGQNSLMAVLGAQKNYFLEYAAYSGNINNLDISIPASQYFGAVAANNPGASGTVATVTRTGGYTLSISDTGVITCAGGAAPKSCADAKCTRGGNRCN